MRKIAIFAAMIAAVLVLFGSCSLLDSVLPAPEVNLSVTPEYCSVGDVVTVSAQVQNFSGEFLSYSWEVNGTVQDVRSNKFWFTVPVDGIWTVALTVSDDTKEAEASVDINAASPGTTSYLNTKKLLGDWIFTFAIGYSVFSDSFFMQFLSESDTDPGTWYAFGVDQYDNGVIGGYSPDIGYSLLNPGNIIDEFFIFSFETSDRITGTYYQIDADTGDWSYGYAVSGIRTAPYSFSMRNLQSHSGVRSLQEPLVPALVPAGAVPESLRRRYEASKSGLGAVITLE